MPKRRTKTVTTAAPDEISELESRIIAAAGERAAFFGLTVDAAERELTAAKKLAKAIGHQLRSEHQARQGGRA